MKVKKAATGPTRVCASTSQNESAPSLPAPTNSEAKKLLGTKAAMMPATVKPMVTSFHTMFHSMA